MTAPRDPDVLIQEFLGEGQAELPDRAFETVRHEIHRTRQRAVIGPWRTPSMNNQVKMAMAAAAIVVVAVAGINLMPRDGAAIGGPDAVSPSPVVSASPEPSPSQRAARLSVAGTGLNGLQLTVTLPEEWTTGTWFAQRGTVPGSGIAFFVSVVDNTFADQCTQIERSAKVGPTVEDLATALGEIPDTTATDPIQTTIAGLEATYLEVQLPASLPCTTPSQFVLWQDSPGNYWYALRSEELFRIWIINVGDQRVVVAGRSYPDTSEELKAEMQGILDSIVFDVGSTSPSGSPPAS